MTFKRNPDDNAVNDMLSRLSNEDFLAKVAATRIADIRRRLENSHIPFSPTLPQLAQVATSSHAIGMGIIGTDAPTSVRNTLAEYPNLPSVGTKIRTTGCYSGPSMPSSVPGTPAVSFGMINCGDVSVNTARITLPDGTIGSLDTVTRDDNNNSPPLDLKNNSVVDPSARIALLPPQSLEQSTARVFPSTQVVVLCTGLIAGYIGDQIAHENRSLSTITSPRPVQPSRSSHNPTITSNSSTDAILPNPKVSLIHPHTITLRRDGQPQTIASAISGYLRRDYTLFNSNYIYRRGTATSMAHELYQKAPALLEDLNHNAVVNDSFTFAINPEGKVVLTSVRRNDKELLTEGAIVFQTPLFLQ